MVKGYTKHLWSTHHNSQPCPRRAAIDIPGHMGTSAVVRIREGKCDLRPNLLGGHHAVQPICRADAHPNTGKGYDQRTLAPVEAWYIPAPLERPDGVPLSQCNQRRTARHLERKIAQISLERTWLTKGMARTACAPRRCLYHSYWKCGPESVCPQHVVRECLQSRSQQSRA
ncbi:uncharacterized protein EI90DRAFT_1860335 [Cantharellus anzutake]|uniref:uncharacterized protein n=1 Tax=Cantharellus anzutake TaxID=1750568 RepID=UPI001906CBEC|nr:uncharacterized protein EI90DRAFT_1860335 [Cantharellus anzutake]KAF8327034.1 hypothetical protein EI90DRAFT_1860335 [Cantharellus anzutake]